MQNQKIPLGDKPMFDFLTPFITPNKDILDIGCGDCSFISLFSSLNKEKHEGIEKNKAFAFLARKKGYSIHILDIEKGFPSFEKKFNLIIAKDILEHVQEPEKITKRISFFLKEDGDFFLSVPSERSILVWDDYTHKRGFSPRALQELLDECGFKIVKIAKDRSLFSPRKSPRRFLSLWLFEKFTGVDLLTQNYLVHAKKRIKKR